MILFVLLVVAGAGLFGQQTPAPIHVLSISAGSSGREVDGNFVMTDERSVFNRSDDREVIVLFRWEGIAGAHKLVAQWRSPDGSLTSNSTIDYEARSARFGAYWRLTLLHELALGMWSIEATVDGAPGGRFSFEVTDRKVPAAITKRPLDSAELYDRLNRVFVVLRRATSAGRELEAASGFSAGDGLIYTAMSTLDDADRIRLVAPDGSEKPVTSVVAWNRREDWAILSGSGGTEPLAVASGNATKVGDRCFSIQGSGAGANVMSQCTISGQQAQGVPSLMATFMDGGGTVGAPVVNGFGELIGLVRGPEVAGAPRLTDRLVDGVQARGTRIVPIGQIRPSAASLPVSLSELRTRGETTPGLVGDDQVVSGGFARAFAKGSDRPTDQRTQFSSTEKTFTVFVNWNPSERLRSQVKLQIFDEDNRVVGESQAAKLDVRKGAYSTTKWELRMPQTPGTYRVDIKLDAGPVWRGFLRITP